MAQDRGALLNPHETIGGRAKETVRSLLPGSFALVMATGIVSVGVRRPLPALSAALLWLGAGCYALLIAAHLWRIAAFRSEMRDDMADPRRSFGFFTFVAGTSVLGTRLVLGGHTGAAVALLGVGGLSWLVLSYFVPWSAALNHGGHGSLPRANGSWFIWIVAGQSVAVLAATLRTAAGITSDGLALLAVVSWSVGAFLYVLVLVLVTARLVLYAVHPADLSPPYWVSMGATAITVLAGSRVIRLDNTALVANTHPFISGAVVAFWAFGTWLVPALVAGGWWRHVARRVPLRYDTSWWSIVFPLGMYGVATRSLGGAEDLTVMTVLGRNMIWVALAAWVVTFAAMLGHYGRTLLAGLAPD